MFTDMDYILVNVKLVTCTHSFQINYRRTFSSNPKTDEPQEPVINIDGELSFSEYVLLD